MTDALVDHDLDAEDDDPYFEDDEPIPLGRLLDRWLGQVFAAAVEFHLRRAATLAGPEAEEAFRIADKIRARAGWTWASFPIGGRPS